MLCRHVELLSDNLRNCTLCLLAGLAANHLSAGAVGPAQERAEIIGAVLAGLCFVMPTIERIIR